MQINQKLLVFIPKIPAYVDTDTEQTTDYIKKYLIDTFKKEKIGIVNDVKLTLIDKRDKSKNYYSCLLIFKKWFETEYVDQYQKSMQNRNLKFYFKKDEFFYIYPQYHVKPDLLENNIINNKYSSNQIKNELNSNSNKHKYDDIMNTLVSQKNLLLAFQQDMMYNFQTIQSNIENLKCHVDYNISLLRQDQYAILNGTYNQQNYDNNNYSYYGNIYSPTPIYNCDNIPVTDIYNRKFTVNLDEEPSWDDSQPIESIQRKSHRRNRKKNKNTEQDILDQLRSNKL
jgi:hypothetical protein